MSISDHRRPAGRRQPSELLIPPGGAGPKSTHTLRIHSHRRPHAYLNAMRKDDQ